MKTIKLICLVVVLFCASFSGIDAQCPANAYWTYMVNQDGGVQFSAFDTSSLTYRYWSFGDGQYGYDNNSPVHQYDTSGTYYVCLYDVNPVGNVCTDTLCRYVQVTVPHNCAGYTVSISDILQPQPPGHTLTAIVGGNNTSGNNFRWSSGQTSGSISVVTGGAYCVTVSNTNIGCYAYACDTVHIADTCAANFTYTLEDSSNGSVKFTNYSTSSDSIVSYSWYFGDNTFSSQRNPSHPFANAGSYNVCLRMQTIGGCVNYYCDSVHIPSSGSTCKANYTYQLQPTFGNVQFSNTSTSSDSITSYYWLWGDNTPSTTQRNPLHVYPGAGVYYTCLYVHTQGGCESYYCDSIRINGTISCSGVTAQWSYTANGGTVQFTAADTANGATHHDWNFGDNSAEGFGSAPSHTYTESGTYRVCQYVYVEAGNTVACVDSLCAYVNVSLPGNCAGLSSNWSSINLTSGNVQFNATDTATGSTHHIWNFGDGTPYSLGVDPVHTYTMSGTYRVCQYTYIVGTTCTDSTCDNIQVTVPSNCTGVTASWTSSNLTNGNVRFTSADTASGSTHHIWNFGDNTASYDVNPTHAYADSGNYYVCQYVYIVGTTCVDSFCMLIHAGAGNNCGNFHAQISASSDSSNVGYKLTSLVSGGSSPYAYKWSSSNTATGSYIIATRSGNYCVTVTDVNGCTTAGCDSVSVNTGNPCEGLTATWRDSILSNGNIQFLPSDKATNVIHAWSFGDGTTSGYFDPIHAYDTAGAYYVCQYVYIAGSTCLDSFCISITVQAGTTCSGTDIFIRDVVDSSDNAHVLTAVNSSNLSFATIRWSNGDTTDIINLHSSGNYCVRVTYFNGCYAYACDSVIIGNTNPCNGVSASWTPTEVQNGGIQFNAVTNPASVSNLWLFGDGTYSTNADPIHYYAQSGLYTVCHFVYTAGYTCADSACRAIQATGSDNCHASFSYITSSTGGTGKIYFTSTSTSNDSITSLNWSFGDGQTGSGSAIAHTYANGGTYYVCLTIATAHSCTVTHCDSVTVGNSSPCHASFSWRPVNCLTVAFENTSAPGYTLQRWDYGDGTTDTSSHPYHTYTQSGTYTVILHTYYVNCYAFDTMVVTLPSCVTNDTVCGVVFEDLNNDGIMDDGETGIIGVVVHVGGVTAITDSSGYYRVILPAGPHYVYIYTPAGCIPTLPLAPDSATNAGGYNGYYITGTGGTYCGYNFGVDCNVVHICGTVYFDANNNGIFDSTETGIPNVHIIITDSAGHTHNAYTNNDGQYCETVPAGNYTITIVSPHTTGTVTPVFISLDATGAGQTYGNNNFGIYSPPGVCDLFISLTAHSTITAGFPAWYSIEVCNVGAISSGGTVSLFYDPALTFNYAYPSQSSYNASTETISWNVNSLDPGQCAYFWVAFKADAPLQLGQPVFTLADVNPGTGCNDANFDNNVDTVQQIVTGSWDPNSKLVSPIGVGPQGYINGSQELKYTLNFQNTGTAPAVNIVVQDVLSVNLNPETFHMIGASHAYTMQIEGNLVVWKFSNIMLPDSGVNEEASHGYITFGITPNQGLAQATQIQNAADIYFDYNQGVATNTTLNTIDVSLSVNNLTLTDAAITLQPNPFKDYTTIQITGAEAPYQMKIYDLLGNLVNTVVAEQNTFNVDRGTLAAGMYLYEVYQQGKIIGKGKMVAQ